MGFHNSFLASSHASGVTLLKAENRSSSKTLSASLDPALRTQHSAPFFDALSPHPSQLPPHGISFFDNPSAFWYDFLNFPFP